ncbi:MAG TPA: TauD/TfdA family dioxygenase [Candidatus Acidoferrum sp.]|jgi:alpha-ketoglutarate-dependent taurine dioxygenase|nr:TauD/TfdA family dioxygenase [Candidatus Acidoferrum sp.]
MTYASIQVEKLTPHAGAEIRGVDLSRPLDERTFKEIHAALIDNGVIFFRDQHLTPDQQKAFGRLFGELHMHPAAPRELPEHPEILVIHADEKSKHVAGENWHSDVSCDLEPPMGSILYMHELPPVGGDTLFASMYAAYEGLSEPMKRFLEPLTAMHEGEHVYRGRYGVNDAGKVFPKAEHPIVRTHPVSGRKALYVNGGFTTKIVQLKRPESDALLQFLYRHVETPEFHCRFRWQVNSIAFWDNRCMQHHAMWDYYPQRRHGHRVTIKGDKPFYRA